VKNRLKLLAIANIVSCSILFGVHPAFAQGEHARRVAAEIRVIIGDIKRLQSPDRQPIHKVGLQHRIQGGLAALDILLRLADQETGKPIAEYVNEVKSVSMGIKKKDFNNALTILVQWEKTYPLIFPEGAPESSSNSDSNIQLGQKIHQEFCAACHDNPVTTLERPAYNLFDEARELAPSEFLARLFVGVRGDRVTGIDNPFSDYEIIALANFYQGKE